MSGLRAIAASVLTFGLSLQPAFGQEFYAIAHMTNSIAAVDWALAEGANAVEIDLQFDASGKPTVFHHGRPCDCTCIGGKYGICEAQPGICKASTDAPAMLKHLANTPGVALVIIDSKISGSEAKQKQAGAEVAQLLTTRLFDAGYAGKVVVSAALLRAITYVSAAATAFGQSKYRSNVYYAVDQQNDVARTIQELIDKVPSANRLYATGSSACLPTQYFSGVALASKNAKAGVIGLVYNWTIDRRESMERYLVHGTSGMITNDPKRLVDLLKSRKVRLATPQSSIPAATSTVVIKQ